MTITKTFTVFAGSPSGVTTRRTTRTLQPTECLVRITHSGLCGTDCYVKHKSQGLGHEGVGIIEAIGSSVPSSALKTGDRVGWGYIHNTCGFCTSCLRGEDAFCHSRQMYQYSNLDQGSLGEYGCWEWKYLFKIPENMESADAAPLQCGGATVFTPLFTGDVRPTDVVGVVGIGGLGHLAVQFAKKMGCRVVVFSGTEGKREESLRLGADRFYVFEDLKTGKSVIEEKVNHLLVTSSKQPDWKTCFNFMEREGSIYPLGLSSGDLSIPYAPLLLNGLKVVGCCVASRTVHTEMLRFAARHGIKPVLEKFPMTVEGINAAYEKLEKGTIRYRAVMVNETV